MSPRCGLPHSAKNPRGERQFEIVGEFVHEDTVALPEWSGASKPLSNIVPVRMENKTTRNEQRADFFPIVAGASAKSLWFGILVLFARV